MLVKNNIIVHSSKGIFILNSMFSGQPGLKIDNNIIQDLGEVARLQKVEGGSYI